LSLNSECCLWYDGKRGRRGDSKFSNRPVTFESDSDIQFESNLEASQVPSVRSCKKSLVMSLLLLMLCTSVFAFILYVVDCLCNVLLKNRRDVPLVWIILCTVCLKTTGPLQLICHNFTSSQRSLIFCSHRQTLFNSTLTTIKSFLIGLEPAVWFP